MKGSTSEFHDLHQNVSVNFVKDTIVHEIVKFRLFRNKLYIRNLQITWFKMKCEIFSNFKKSPKFDHIAKVVYWIAQSLILKKCVSSFHRKLVASI